MSKKKIKTTKTAKLSGILSGFGAWALIYWLLLLIALFSKHVLNVKTSGNFAVYFGLLLLIIGPVLAVFAGRLANKRWETLSKLKRYLLNGTSALLILAIVIFLSFISDGKKTVTYYENGQKKNQSNFKNGKMDGLVKGWYENGNKKLEKNFKDGKRDGSSVMWYENGQKMEEIMYKNDQKDGLETQWHENGNKKLEVNVINDKYMDYVGWYEDGQKKSEGYWVEELKSFLVNEWYENGKKKIEREWDGEDLIERRYNNKGETIRATIDTKAKSRVKAE